MHIILYLKYTRVKNLLLLFSFIVIILHTGNAQNENAFVIYNSKGKKVSYKKMQKVLLAQEFVFFGEYHDNPISHWLELEILEDLTDQHGEKLQVGFEMFEQDQQMLLNDYMNGLLTDKQFEDSCRLWPNYKTDYKPLIMHAKANKLYCIASNVPRKYASLLFKKGRSALDTLSAEEKAYLPPLDFVIDTTLSQYASLKEMEQHMGGGFLMEAQALKDAAMAYFLLLNRKEGNVVYHVNGAYHSDYQQGIVWFVRKAKPNAKIATITTVTQEDITKLDKENLSKADFIICVPEKMTRTH